MKYTTAFGSSFNIEVRKNVHLVNNVVLQHEGIRFVFSTLWTKVSAENENAIEQGVADFECILKKDRKLKIKDYNKLHSECINFLKPALKEKTEKTIVVSHHLWRENVHAVYPD